MIDKLTDEITFVFESDETSMVRLERDQEIKLQDKHAITETKWLHLHLSESVDLLRIDDQHFAHKMVRLLQDNLTFELPFTPTESIQQHIFSLWREKEVKSKLWQTHRFGIGYPIMHVQQPNQQITAPLIFWPMELQPDQAQVGKWICSRNDYDRPIVNTQLLQAIDQLCNTKLHAKWKDKEIILSADIKALAFEAGKALSAESEGLPLSLGNLRNPKAMSDENYLEWGAACFVANQIGLVSEQKTVNPKPKHVQWTHTFPLVSTNPDQYRAFRQALTHPISMVIGDEAHGKSAVAEALACISAQQEKRCLLISASGSFRSKVKQKLCSLGLGHLVADIPGVLCPPTVHSPQEGQAGDITDVLDPSNAANTISHYFDLLDHAFDLDSEGASGYRYADLVLHCLEAGKKAKSWMLDAYLQPERFMFDAQEWSDLRVVISKAQSVFQNYPVDHLPMAFMQWNQYEEHTKEGLVKRLQSFLSNAIALKVQIEDALNEFRKVRLETYLDHFAQVQMHLKKVDTLIDHGRTVYGDAIFREIPKSFLGLTKHQKEINEFQHHIKDAIKELRELEVPLGEIQAQYPQFQVTDQSWNGLLANYQSYRQDLMHCEAQVPDLVKSEMQRNDSREEAYRSIMTALDHFIQEVKVAGYYPLERTVEHQTVYGRLQDLNEVIRHLRLLMSQTDFLPKLAPWFDLLHQCSDLGRYTLKALTQSHPDDWTATFDVWYLNRLLQTTSHQRPDRSEPSEWDCQDEDLLTKTRASVLAEIKQNWHLKMEGTREITQPAADSLPIWMVCDLSDLRNAQHDFDMILFDAGDMPQALIDKKVGFMHGLCANLIIFKDQESIKVDTKSYPSIKLRNADHLDFHRAHFMHLAFQFDKPQTACCSLERPTYQISMMDGAFDAVKMTNKEEAQALIKQLNTVQRKEDGQWPKVSIIAATVEQSNLIAYELLKVSQLKTSGYEKVDYLQSAGLTILALQDVQYLIESDLIFMTCVFGKEVGTNTMTAAIAALNEQSMIKGLKNAMSGNYRSFHLFHSIPDFMQRVYVLDCSNHGTQILGFWIDFILAACKSSSALQEMLQNMQNKIAYNARVAQPLTNDWELKNGSEIFFLPGRLEADWLMHPDCHQKVSYYYRMRGLIPKIADISNIWKFT